MRGCGMVPKIKKCEFYFEFDCGWGGYTIATKYIEILELEWYSSFCACGSLISLCALGSNPLLSIISQLS